MFKRISCAAAAVVLMAGFALAADDLGVKISPGAKKSEQWTKLQNEVLKAAGSGGTGAYYLTKDPVAKVADFYLKNGFKLTFGQVTPDGAMLQMGDKVSMDISNMKKVDNTDGTKICFAKK